MEQELLVLYMDGTTLKRNGGSFASSFEELTKRMATVYAVFVVMEASDLPVDFSVDTYTIADGQLVPAPAELLVERQAARRVAEREAIRAERERRYQSEPIASLYWTWIESGVEADRSAWITAKEAVRLELPYPDAQEGGAQ